MDKDDGVRRAFELPSPAMRPNHAREMNWNGNPYRHAANDAEDLSYPPSGGRVKMILLGIILPLVIAWFGVGAWISEEATWFGSRGSDLVVKGAAAKSIAVAYLSIGSFCHFRWFWGLLPVWRVFEAGVVL
jgi:hypothetical protein